MSKFPVILALMLCAAIFSPCAKAQDGEENWIVKKLSDVFPGTVQGDIQFDQTTGTAFATNGIFIQYIDPNKRGSATLTADSASVNTATGDVEADGNVHIESADMVWVGEHIHYNFKTRVMTSEQFRTGHLPVFASGDNLTANTSNRVYDAHHAVMTTDNYSDPFSEIRASTVRIIPGKKIEMWNAVVYVDGLPVFYFPYYERNIAPRSNNFSFTPGYRSRYGAYLLDTYNWYLGDWADGKIHADERIRRGPGVGPDVDLTLGEWGDATIKYYYQHDQRSDYSTNVFPYYGHIPENRQRFYLGWQATPATNLDVKALVNYESDPLFLHDFFESDYTLNPQPNTFVEADKYWENWSLDALTTPRVNSYFSQIERLPDVKLTGFNQQILNTPLYYNSESSLGFYRSWDANATNGLYPATNGVYVAEATRADTYHQITMPWTFFNWLNVTPRVGGRVTYYSSQNFTNGQPSSDVVREVFNSGVEFSFKASQLWPDVTNSLLQVDGLRHIMEPSVNYVFIPDPSVPPAQLPQFDSAASSILPLPVFFPDYNNIDSIDAMNAVRFGLRNVLQTKRNGQLEDLVNWNLSLDWRLDGPRNQNNFDDLYSALSFRPRDWITFDSQVRYDLEGGNLDLAFHQITFTPNDHWSWGISHWYLRAGFVGPDENNFIVSTLYYKVDENWGMRASHAFNAQTGRLQEQDYTIYRDLRSWTAALSFRAESSTTVPTDFSVDFSFSLKAVPSTHVGEDAVNSFHLVGE